MTVTALGGRLGSDGTFAVDANGSIAVTTAVVRPGGSVEVVSVRYASDGELEADSGDAGITTVAVPGAIDAASASAFAPGGALLLSGASYAADFATGDGWVARLDLDGNQDAGFAGGAVAVRYDLEYTAFNGLALDEAERVVVAGWDFSETPEDLPASDFVLARYLANGSPDASFGDGGMVHVDVRGGAAVCGPAEHIE